MMVEPECFIRRIFISWILLVGLIQEVSAKNIVVFMGTLNDKRAIFGDTVLMRLGSSKGITSWTASINHKGDDFRLGETDGYSYTYSDAELAYPITQVEFCASDWLPHPHWGISDIEIIDKDQGQWFLFHFNNYLSKTLYIGSGPAAVCRTETPAQSSITPSPLKWTITTTTDGSSGSDTGSKISIIMFGRNSTKTRTHTLRNVPVDERAFKKDFQKGQTSQFTIRTIFIEPITQVKVCTDCLGKRPSWRNKEFKIESPKTFGQSTLRRPTIHWIFSSPKEFDCNNLCHIYDVTFCGGRVFQKPDVQKFNLGEYYTYECIPQLGIDTQADMSIGISTWKNKTDANDYKANAMKTWSRLYSYTTKKKVGNDQGTKPDTFQVINVTTGYHLDQGGHFGIIKFRIGPGIGRYDHRQITCGSTTSPKRQVALGFVQSPMGGSHIDVKFLPLKPNLTILWQAGAPFIVPGGQLKAKCDVFLGTVNDDPVFSWRLESPGGEKKTWETRKFENKIIEDGVAVSGFPGRKSCQSGATYNDGRCFYLVKDVALSYREAMAYCKRYIDSKLLQIENADDFKHYLGVVGLEGFWIDANDRLQEGVFKRWDGRSANLDNWGYFYEPTEYDSPMSTGNSEENDCVILQKGGFQSLGCDQKMPFMCRSDADFIQTPRNFDPDFGPKWSFILTIDVKNKDLLDGSNLRCEVEKPGSGSSALTVLNKLGISLISDRSDVLKYFYRPLRPTIVDTSLKQSDSIKVQLQCSSIVAMDDGAITWTMKQTDGVERTWIIGDNPVEKNPHKFIDVVLLNDKKDSDSGRFMSTNMTIEFNEIFQMSEFSCYSYNKELPFVETSNVYGPEDLKDVYLMNFLKLKGVSFWEIEDIYGIVSFTSSKSTNSTGKVEEPARRSFVMLSLLALLILGSLALGLFLMSKKSVVRMAVVKNESEAGGRH